MLFDAWCALCLVTAAISVVMIGPAMDEVLASLQHLRREADAGRWWWRAFWSLGEAASSPEPAARVGGNVWAHVACTALGVWLMAAPQLLGCHGPARTNAHVVGPVAAAAACVAIWEATRPLR